MKKFLRKVLVVSLSLVLFSSLTLSVSAASLKDLFDADYYLEQYPDLQKVLGDNEEALYNHYIIFGLKEGRNASTLFDVNKYREMYPDLEAAFGDNWQAYAEHYVSLGINEERDGGGEFDAVSYAKRYPDVYEAYGLDISKLKEHYEVFGKSENREALSQAVVDEQEAIAEAAADEIDTAKFQVVAMHLHNLTSYYRSYTAACEDQDEEAIETYVNLYNETYLLYDAARDSVLATVTQEELDYFHDLFTKITSGSGLWIGYLPESLGMG